MQVFEDKNERNNSLPTFEEADDGFDQARLLLRGGQGRRGFERG